MIRLPFEDRSEAGRELAMEMIARKPSANAIVLALLRGGLPVAAELAAALRTPLDFIVVRKLGVPWRPELAMGAIAGTTRVLDHQLIHELDISGVELESVIAQEMKEIERREKLYRDGLPAPTLRGRGVIFIDDGLATGSTMLAAARHVRSFNPQKLIIAVPVGSTLACEELAREADECICLATPEPFFAVGEWYKDFRQVTDQDVREILRRTRSSVRSVA